MTHLETELIVRAIGALLGLLWLLALAGILVWDAWRAWRARRRTRRKDYVFRKGDPAECLVGMESSMLDRTTQPGAAGFDATLRRELADFEAAARREDELLASAAAGGPFWRTGEPAAIRGLGGFLPSEAPAPTAPESSPALNLRVPVRREVP